MLCRELLYKSSWTSWKYRNRSSACVKQRNSTNCAGLHRHKTGAVVSRVAYGLCWVWMLFVRWLERGISGHFYSICKQLPWTNDRLMDFTGAPVKWCQCDCVWHPGCPSCLSCLSRTGVFPSNSAHATSMHSFDKAAGPVGSAKPIDGSLVTWGFAPWGCQKFLLAGSKRMGVLSGAAFPSIAWKLHSLSAFPGKDHTEAV